MVPESIIKCRIRLAGVLLLSGECKKRPFPGTDFDFTDEGGNVLLTDLLFAHLVSFVESTL